MRAKFGPEEIMIIDAHHHFWNYNPEEYDWIGTGMEVLRRDFHPGDLEPLLDASGVDGVISVQARTNSAENEALLAQARRHDFVKGVVGWVDLTGPRVAERLEAYGRDRSMKGFRHVLQGEPDERYMLRADFNRGVGRLREYGFVYDILILARHLRYCPAFVDQHPGQTFVIDHLAKPRIAGEGPDPAWVAGMREMARRPHVSCKVSGMVTEMVPGLAVEAAVLRPWFDVVLEAFGPDRLLFGSDWPVCLLRAGYSEWAALARAFVAELSGDEQTAILGGNAVRIYDLDSA